MNCSLFHHLQQMAYLANLKGEWAEQERYEREAIAHAFDCPFCNGVPDTLAEQLFGRLVVVTREKHTNRIVNRLR